MLLLAIAFMASVVALILAAEPEPLEKRIPRCGNNRGR